jgi:hypothetical protein
MTDSMARPSSHPFDLLARRFAEIVADRVAAAIPAAPRRGLGRPPGFSAGAKLRGRKLDMRCRYPGCKNKSKGPRFRFLCEKHLKLPKAEQNAALAKWAAKNA